MRNLLKGALITSGVLLVAGIVLCFSGKALGGKLEWGYTVRNGNVKNYSGIMVHGEETFDGFDAIKTDTHSFNVYLQPGEEYKVEYYVKEDYLPTIKVENNTLVITQKETGMVGFFTTELTEEAYVTITVPRDVEQEYQIDMSVSSDKIELKDLHVNGKIRMTSGDLVIANVTAKDIALSMTSGDTKITDMVAETLDVNLTSGNVSMKNVVANKIIAKMSSGTVEGTNIQASDIYNKMTSGDAEWNLVGSRKDYNWNFKKTSGDITLGDEKIKDDCTMENGAEANFGASLTSGDLEITFVE